MTVKRLAAPTALKSAAWATSKRHLVPHQKLPLPLVLDNPLSGHLQWAQTNLASIYNRQSTLASTAQTIHSPRPTPVDPSLSTEPLTFPPPSRLRPLQFLSPFPPPPPSKLWWLLRHNPLSLRCRASRRRLLETVASRRKRRLSSGTMPIHLIFYGFGREGWILHNHLGWVSVSVSVSQIRMAGWQKKNISSPGNEYILLDAGGHTFWAAYEMRAYISILSLHQTHSSPAVPYIFTSSGGHHHPQTATLTHNHRILSIYDFKASFFPLHTSQMYHQKQHHPEFHLMYEQKKKVPADQWEE